MTTRIAVVVVLGLALRATPGAPAVQAAQVTALAPQDIGSRVLPHTHPDDEVVTVIAGTWYLGLGETFNEAALRAYPDGSFIVIPGGVPHFLATKSEPVIVQVSGHGIFRTNDLIAGAVGE